MSELKVEEFLFADFSKVKAKGKNTKVSSVAGFEMKNFQDDVQSGSRNMQKVIKAERISAKKNQFLISDIVLKHRGMQHQEWKEINERVEAEVMKRLTQRAKQVEEEAFKKGIEQGTNQAINDMQEKVQEKLEVLSQVIQSVSDSQVEVLKKQKQDIHDMLTAVAKWIILRDLKGDRDYISRLLEKLILDLQTRENLIIHVNKDNFSDMPHILSSLEKKLGSLVNTRLEINPEIQNGIILESENGILNGTMEEQFANLDKVFEKINVFDNE